MIRYAIDSHTGKIPPDLRMTISEGSPVSCPMAIIVQPLSEDSIHDMEVALEADYAAHKASWTVQEKAHWSTAMNAIDRLITAEKSRRVA